jgi:biotin carboxyl carrier protein
MNVDVMVNGRQWKVALEAPEQSGQVIVTIKGKSRVVDASWIDADTLSLIDAGRACEIRMHPRTHTGAVDVDIGGRLYEAVASAGDTRLKSRPTDSAVATDSGVAHQISVGPGFSQAIKAPMPGRVVRVLVAVGDRVTARQAVVVVEAMKMENELRTPREGVVKEVLVAPGAAVESGAVLVVVD